MQSESDGTSAEAVVIELIGKAKAHVVYYTHQSRNVSYKSEKFLKFDTQLGSFGGHAPTGVHTFPFGLQLPATIPSSMKVRTTSACYLGPGSANSMHGLQISTAN